MPRLYLIILLSVANAPAFSLSAERKLDFNRDIRPILSENCFQCHGFDEKARQADLRLDVGDSALEDRGGTPAIVSGNATESELYRRIISSDESELMPPPDSHRSLKPEQIETLKLWIEQGAPYAKHWSFIPPVKAPLPDAHVAEFLRNSNSTAKATRLKEWPRNEVDHFILARLVQEGLQPSAEADRRTLIRRVTLDLTGLPPSAEEVQAFVDDKSPDAYEKLVDRLLASPHFGERMALVWLDAARYADTNGFSIDGGRHMWLWRDWVINAFNANMPYSQFITEQLAGDLIPNYTEAQLVATGFQRNNMNTHEGGTIPEENLTNYNVDRVKTFGESILGLTLGCCQCHDHKFDPLTQRDYYQIYAYFNTLSDVGLDGDRGIDSRPFIEAKTVLRTGEVPGLEKQIIALKTKLAHPRKREIERWANAQRKRLSARGKDFKLHPVELLKVSTPNSGTGYDIDPPRFVHISSAPALVAYDVSLSLPKLDEPITGVRVVFHPDANAPGLGRGYGPSPQRAGASSPPPKSTAKLRGPKASRRKTKKPPVAGRGTFILTALSASADPVPGDNINLNRLLGFSQATADSWLPDWRPEGVIDTRGENGWSPGDDEVASSTGELPPAYITVTFDKPLDAAATPFMTLQLNFGHVDSTVAARFEVLAMTGADDGSDLPKEIIEIINDTNTPPAPGPAGGSSQPIDPPGATAGSPSSAQPAESQSSISDSEPNQLAATSNTTSSVSDSLAPRASHLAPLSAYYSAHAAETRRDRIALANLEERLAVLTNKFPTMVMDVSPTPRETHILNRGDYSQPLEKVIANTPAVLSPLAPSSSPLAPPSTRLDLANWLTMPEHPLTARVEVNRIWQMLLGTGLVATSADFGAQGEYPSHPELLDWLAVDFRENGWNVKRLIKQIVTSATYRQTSDSAPRQLASTPSATGSASASDQSNDLLARDPNNRLLARGPRFRLPAEFVRDAALKTSGLMVDRLGGPSVNPYTPGNLWREISHYGSTPATAQTFEQDHGEKLYRRSLYTYWKRTVPPPNMVAFDAPNREICTVARASTTTPLQALVLLNDVQFVEASRAFAERIIAQSTDDNERIRWAFEECVAREPTSNELAILNKTLARERKHYSADNHAAQKLLFNGESPRNEKIPAPEHAAWSQVAALLLNLSETVTRN